MHFFCAICTAYNLATKRNPVPPHEGIGFLQSNYLSLFHSLVWEIVLLKVIKDYTALSNFSFPSSALILVLKVSKSPFSMINETITPPIRAQKGELILKKETPDIAITNEKMHQFEISSQKRMLEGNLPVLRSSLVPQQLKSTHLVRQSQMGQLNLQLSQSLQILLHLQ